MYPKTSRVTRKIEKDGVKFSQSCFDVRWKMGRPGIGDAKGGSLQCAMALDTVTLSRSSPFTSHLLTLSFAIKRDFIILNHSQKLKGRGTFFFFLTM